MSKALTLGLCLHCSVSFFILLLGVFRLLPYNVAMAAAGLVVAAVLFFGIFRLALPAFAKSGARREFVVFESLASACVANYFGFLLVAGLAKKFNIGPDWLANGVGLGVVIGFLPWAHYQLKLRRMAQEERNHQAAVTESKRLLELDAPKDAEDKLKESLLQAEVVFGSNHLHPAQAAMDLGRYYVETEQRQRAAAMFSRALQIREKLLGEDDVRVSGTLMDWVNADDELDPSQAIAQMRKALLILERQLGAYAPPVALAYERVGELQQRQNNAQEAENALRRSYSILKKAESQSNRDLFRVGLKLSRIYLELKRPKDSQETLAGLDSCRSTQKPEMQLEYLMVQMTTLGELNEQQASQDRAWEALQLLQRDLGPSTSEFKAIWEGCLDRLTEPFLDPEARTVYTATLGGDSYSIRQILQNHPEWVNQKDASGWNLLQWSCFFGHERMVEAFLAQGASVDEITDEWPPLHIACRWAHRRLIALLANKAQTQNQLTKQGWHPLHRCSQNGDSRLMELLTAKDLEIDPVNDRGDTPLLLACRLGHYLMAVGLVARGADVNKVNGMSGRSPLHEAAYVGHRAIAECLIHNGAKIDARDRAGLTPAELAAQAEKEAVVKLIQSLAKGHKA
ncbi:MAG: ankyrin repeat domain-containing protein [Candidatus Eremiobacteraeota bacterium]|nr:ankyrin repeat domain-containing protein [Candidatus Eremiobacteraeota bacterium]MCW5867491.1 ankyrin repeat domain-containing protein [Candidatus Eremiobacteraeota bacterium]